MLWCGTLCIWHNSSKNNKQFLVPSQNPCMHVTRHVFLLSSTVQSITFNTFLCDGISYILETWSVFGSELVHFWHTVWFLCVRSVTATVHSVMYVRTHTFNLEQVCYICSMWHSGLYVKTLALIIMKGDYVLVSCNRCCLEEWNWPLLLLNRTE